MYLFIFADGKTRQVEDNLTILDLLAVKQNLLTIFCLREGRFHKVLMDEARLCYVPVHDSSLLISKEGRCHHT
jgi:hypothetical protein